MARSAWLAWSTRVGFIGYGVLHLAVAWLSWQIMTGRGTPDGGQTGAFRTVAERPLGHGLLTVIVVGLAAMAIWQLLLAAVGHRQEVGWHRPVERLASLGRYIIYAALALTGLQVLRGTAMPSARQQQQMTAGVLNQPAGPALVIAAGILIVLLGVGMGVYGGKKMFVRRLRVGQMPQPVGEATIRLGQFGYIAKGLAFASVGVLTIAAGATADPGRSGGLDDALKTLARQPYGTWLLAIITAGFAAFGIYCFAQARYRRI